MKFIKYLNDVTINLADKNDPDIEEKIEENFLSEAIDILEDLNKSLNLNKNKVKFCLTKNKNMPSLKNRDEEILTEKWLLYNEKLTRIKKDFLSYIENVKFS